MGFQVSAVGCAGRPGLRSAFTQFLSFGRLSLNDRPRPAVISDKKIIAENQRQEILKYTPAMRNPLYGLTHAADHLESWVYGTLQLEPLLDVSG